MKKNSILRKVLAVSLAAAMLAGTGFTAVGQLVGTNVSVSASETYGDFEYEINADNTVTITNYTGKGGNVTVPSKINGKIVAAIGNDAFYYADKLEAITIPNSVKSIGRSAFEYCRGLTSITIPDSVQYIGSNAFDCCSNLKSINLGKGVILIGKAAFYECTSLTSITIPDSVKTISDYAFEYCSGLTNIYIGSGVQSINRSVFEGCESLEKIDVSKNNTVFSSYGGVLLNKDKTEVMMCPYGKKGTYSIPKTVKSIGEYAFKDSELTSITIPNGVTSIGYEAFFRCSNLTSITIPNSVTSIDGWVFSECKELQSVIMPDNITSMSDGIFSECNSLKNVTIPAKVTSIGYCTFYRCSNLTSITIPDSVTSIDSRAFEDCEKLANIVIPDSVTEISKDAFYSTAWYDSLPDGIVCAGKVLYQYKGTMPENTKIVIPNGVKSIAGLAFYNCEGLTGITIPNSVTSIGNIAFYGCENLKNISIPDSVGFVGRNAFDNTVWYDNQPNGIVYTGKFLYKYKGTMPANTKISIPSGILSIGESAFNGCNGLTSITIPNTMKSIGDCAFNKCGLTSITIPSSVSSIGSNAFDECEKLASIHVNANNKAYASDGGILLDKNKTVLMLCPPKKQGTYTIPNSVKEICSCAFYRSELTNITIPDSVTSIGQYCFSNSSLVSIKIPGSIKSLSYGAFNEAPHLQEAILEYGVSEICGYAFRNCEHKIDVVIPESVNTIDEWAFPGSSVVIYGKKGSCAEEYGSTSHAYCDISFVSGYSNISRIDNENIIIGDSVTINANAVLGEGDYTYAVLYKRKTQSKWTTAQDFGTNDTVKIKPASVADYDICVKVKDSTGQILKKYFTVKVSAKLVNTSTISAENITLGQNVTVNCLATGGVSEYQYQVLYKQTSLSSWAKAQDFSENTSVTFKPAKAAAYDVCVKVRDETGKIEKKYFTVNVSEKLNNTSTISAAAVRQGASVTLKGSATGGAGNYTYAVYYKQKAQSKWTAKQSFSENSVVSVKPAQATDYDICIKVKDKDGTVAKKYFEVTVTK